MLHVSDMVYKESPASIVYVPPNTPAQTGRPGVEAGDGGGWGGGGCGDAKGHACGTQSFSPGNMMLVLAI
jgi:hypothetical protein